MKLYEVREENYGTQTEIFIVNGPGLEPDGIAFLERLDALSCAIACELVHSAGVTIIEKENT